MHQVVQEVVVCILYLSLVLLLAYTNRDPLSYRTHESLDNIFNKGNIEGAITGRKQAFHKVCFYYHEIYHYSRCDSQSVYVVLPGLEINQSDT